MGVRPGILAVAVDGAECDVDFFVATPPGSANAAVAVTRMRTAESRIPVFLNIEASLG
jgi:hypothetical protein